MGVWPCGRVGVCLVVGWAMRSVKKTREKLFRLSFSTVEDPVGKVSFFDCVRKPDLGFSRKRPFSTDTSDCIRTGLIVLIHTTTVVVLPRYAGAGRYSLDMKTLTHVYTTQHTHPPTDQAIHPPTNPTLTYIETVAQYAQQQTDELVRNSPKHAMYNSGEVQNTCTKKTKRATPHTQARNHSPTYETTQSRPPTHRPTR